jgi:LemA protein
VAEWSNALASKASILETVSEVRILPPPNILLEVNNMNIILIALVVILVLIVIVYNSLIGKKNQVQNSFAAIDTMLKKRYDLIPNLIASVQQYMTYEKGTLTELTALRVKAVSGQVSDDQKMELDNKISKMLGGIMVAVENYPALKANENFLQLQRALNEIEEQLSAARRAFNAAVTDFNNAVEMFPTSFFASMMGYSRKALFEVSDSERKNVDVKELFKK